MNRVKLLYDIATTALAVGLVFITILNIQYYLLGQGMNYFLLIAAIFCGLLSLLANRKAKRYSQNPQ